MKKDFGNGAEKGRLLSYGRGWADMMAECKRYGWTTENTILVVANSNDLNSRWKIYAKKGAQV